MLRQRRRVSERTRKGRSAEEGPGEMSGPGGHCVFGLPETMPTGINDYLGPGGSYVF
jgi:hypothetical protein